MPVNISKDLIELLNSEAHRINNVSFIEKDPVQFPRLFSAIEDIEIMSLISALFAWGNRKMICRDIEKTMVLMDHQPFNYVMDEGYEDLDDNLNLHRTFFARDLKYLLRGLRKIYKKFSSLDEFAFSYKVGDNYAPAWVLVEKIQMFLREANGNCQNSRCLPVNLKTTALKRINMALRWLVRNDGIVDMGLWKSIPKSKLFIPLDVHVGDVARELELINRKSNDRKTVYELTSILRELNPEDPVLYDFALFGIGMKL